MKKKMRSFASRLTWSIVLMMLLAMGLASWLIYEAATSLVREEEFTIHRTCLETHVEVINDIVSDVHTGTINHVPEIEENLGHPDRMHGLMERIVKLNPYIRSCGLAFVADLYPQKGHWFCPYAVKHDSTHIETMTIGSADYDYLKAKWFTEAVEKNEPYWSEPFLDSTDSTTLLVSYLVPIHDKKGRTVGILGADMSLEWLGKKLEEADWEIFFKRWTSSDEEREERKIKEEKKTWRKPYSFIVTGNGTYLVHPDKERVLHKNILDYAKESPDTAFNLVARQMLAGKKGFYGMEGDEETYEDEAEAMVLEGRDVYLFFAPIKHTGWSIAMAVPTLGINLIAFAVGFVLLFLIALGLLVAFLVSRFVIRRAVKPLKQLATSANEVAKGNFNTPLPRLRHNDEIKQLRDAFGDMQQSLTTYIAELKDTTASKAAIENELQVAHAIQMGMLPKTFPPYPDRNDVDIFASLDPAKEVGGDLFDFHICNNRLLFCIGDVSGKGVPASLVMAVTRSLFRNISAHTDEPHHIIAALNDVLVESNETNMFVTFFVGVLNLENGILRYCNAGHDAPMLIGKEVRMLPCDANIPLGVMPEWQFSVQETHIDPQTTIFLYTDGLTEAENAGHAQFGSTRTLDIAEALPDEGRNTPAELISRIKEAVHSFVGGAEQSDDQTMLAIRYNGCG